MQYEFQIYNEDGDQIATEFGEWSSDKAAKAKAARFAKKNGGNVDLARAGPGDWNGRYITTCSATFLSAWYERGSNGDSPSNSRFWHIEFNRLD